MPVTVELSSDLVGGVLALVLAVVGYTISSIVYPRLMGKSVSDAVRGGKAIEASTRSIKSVRNCLGFWTLSLTILAHLLAFSLEFGLQGLSAPVTSTQPAVILGGGRRFSTNHTANGELFMNRGWELPIVFVAAVGACYSLEAETDFKIIKNHYPAIEVSQNSSGTDVSSYEFLECTSLWAGSAEWTVEPAGNLTIELDSVREQYRYEDDVNWSFETAGPVGLSADLLSVSYGSGTSFRDQVTHATPAVLVNISRSGSFQVFAISITEENGHYVYSLSNSMESSTIGGREVLAGPFMQGHFRSSEYSLGGVVSMVLAMSYTHQYSLFDIYYYSFLWWESETTRGVSLVHSNPEGSEQSWPSLSDDKGNVYTEYKKATQPTQYPFKVGEAEATLVSSWAFVLAAILAVTVFILTAASLRMGTPRGFWTYDGLSRMMREEIFPSGNCANPSILSHIGIVGRGDSEHIGFLRDGKQIEPKDGRKPYAFGTIPSQRVS